MKLATLAWFLEKFKKERLPVEAEDLPDVLPVMSGRKR